MGTCSVSSQHPKHGWHRTIRYYPSYCWGNGANGNIGCADSIAISSAFLDDVDRPREVHWYAKGFGWVRYEEYDASGNRTKNISWTTMSSTPYLVSDVCQPEAKTGGDLYAFNRNDAGSNSTAVHVLTRAGNYQGFSLQTGTALEKTGTDGSWQLLAGDYNGDGVQDVYVIKKANTGSGRTEVHVLNGANLSQFLLHIATPLGLTGTDQRWVFQLADFNRDGKLDVYAIDKMGASSAEVHVLDGASNFQAWLQHSATAVPRTATDHRSEFLVGDYNQDGQPDLYWIYRANTGTRTTEVHVVNGANLGSWLLETGIAADYLFSLGDYNGDGRLDVFLIKKTNTGTGKTEVHVLDGAGNFQQWLLQTGTALGVTGSDDGWQFDL